MKSSRMDFLRLNWRQFQSGKSVFRKINVTFGLLSEPIYVKFGN
jgi:hypothetical protein